MTVTEPAPTRVGSLLWLPAGTAGGVVSYCATDHGTVWSLRWQPQRPAWCVWRDRAVHPWMVPGPFLHELPTGIAQGEVTRALMWASGMVQAVRYAAPSLPPASSTRTT